MSIKLKALSTIVEFVWFVSDKDINESPIKLTKLVTSWVLFIVPFNALLRVLFKPSIVIVYLLVVQ